MVSKAAFQVLLVVTLSLFPHRSAGAADEKVPLTLVELVFVPGERQAEARLRNDGSQPVVAWALEVSQEYSDGSSRVFGLSQDSYMDRAGLLGQDRPGNRVLLPGAVASISIALNPGGDDQSGPSAVTVRPVEALLGDRTVVGSGLFVRGVLDGRKRDARALAEVLQVLADARTRNTDPGAAIGAAIDALSVPVNRHYLKTQARAMLQRANATAATGGLEQPAMALTSIIEETRRRAAAAEEAVAWLQPLVPTE
ncbi:MAG: hypothetical protein E6J47_08030 [Chloroflexi bacterium]|nr:MAG: hypothetical protein E6J47_08030 [Chloroflexota bacterium]